MQADKTLTKREGVNEDENLNGRSVRLETRTFNGSCHSTEQRDAETQGNRPLHPPLMLSEGLN